MTTADWNANTDLVFRKAVAGNMTAICGIDANDLCTYEDVIILDLKDESVTSPPNLPPVTRRRPNDLLRVTYEIVVMSSVSEETIIILDTFAISNDFLVDLQNAGLSVVSINIVHGATQTVKILRDNEDEANQDVFLVAVIVALVLSLFCCCCVLWYFYRHSVGKSSVPSALQYSSKLQKEFNIKETLSEQIPLDLTSVCLIFGSMRLNIIFFLLVLLRTAITKYFIGRFPAPPQAMQLEIELKKLGIRLKIVNIDAGGDIDQEVRVLPQF